MTDSTTNRLWSLIRQLQNVVSLIANMKIGVGVASGTWPGSSPRANNTSVAHSLGSTPVVVLACVASSPSGTWFPIVATVSYTDTTWDLTAVSSDGSSPTAGTGYGVVWLAVG